MTARATQPLPHHRPEGGFQNPWPAARPHGFLDFLKWTLIERPRKRAEERPVLPTFPRTEPTFITPRPDPSVLTITWIGHSSFLIQIGGLNVLLDPIWSRRASPVSFIGPSRLVPAAVDFDRLPPIDVVVLSHDHYDHLDMPTIKRLVERFPAITWFVPLGVRALVGPQGALEVAEMDWQAESAVAGLRVACVPAQHFSGRWLNNRNETLWCGWVLRSGSHSVFFAGDTGLHPEFGEIASSRGPFDLAILPIGAYEPRWFMGPVHMNPEDCLIAVRAMRAQWPEQKLVMVGAHWGTFKLTDEPADEPPRRMREVWGKAGLDPDDLWIMQHGETRMIRKPSHVAES